MELISLLDYVPKRENMLHLIVPYRDRAVHLAEFLPYMHAYLADTPHHFWIIEQSSDSRLFNRGALLNCGFLLASEESKKEDAFIFHDVDTLPDEELKQWYVPPPNGTLYHIAAVSGNRYVGSWGFGGIVSFRGIDYKLINGHPNRFFGWGGEDDELRRRAQRCGLWYKRPDRGSVRDLEDTTLEDKLAWLKAGNLKNPLRKQGKIEHAKTWHGDGVNQTQFHVLEKHTEDNVTLVIVELLGARQEK